MPLELTGKPTLIHKRRLTANQTRTKSTKDAAISSRMRSRRILFGYPLSSRDLTDKEIKHYLKQEQITCLLCGKDYKNLALHLPVHEITPDMYRKRYGLPYSIALCSAGLSEQKRKEMLEKLDRTDKGGLKPIKTGEIRPKKKKDRISAVAIRKRKENMLKARKNCHDHWKEKKHERD